MGNYSTISRPQDARSIMLKDKLFSMKSGEDNDEQGSGNNHVLSGTIGNNFGPRQIYSH
jgi:hypothetical protein